MCGGQKNAEDEKRKGRMESMNFDGEKDHMDELKGEGRFLFHFKVTSRLLSSRWVGKE